MSNFKRNLPPDLKARWVAALRSGEFPQGHGYLLNDGRYCCLGVLASVYGEPENRIGGYHSISSFSPLDQILDPAYTRALQSHLERMNDSGCSFEEIADWIEQNV